MVTHSRELAKARVARAMLVEGIMASTQEHSTIATRARMPRPRRPRVMVAEDCDEMRLLVVEALRKNGYDVREAANGSQLLGQILAQEVRPDIRVDLIVSDVRMPVWNGLQVLEAMHDDRWTIPVILMTAFGDEPTRAAAARLGAVLFDKPFAIADLLVVVAELLPSA